MSEHQPETAIIEPPPFSLDYNDRQSVTWNKLAKYLNQHLQSLRVRNDTELDATATAKLRGEITAVKNILALGEKAPDGVVDED